MPDDQPQIITPTQSGSEPSGEPPAAERPITVGYEPAAPASVDPVLQSAAPTAPPEPSKPSPIAITVQDETGVPLPTAGPQPAQPIPDPVPAMPAPQPAEPAPVPTSAAPASPAPQSPLGLTPPVLDKETLQDKINNHPLFSGAKDRPFPKQRKAKKWLVWALIVLLILIVGAYLAIDSGLVRGASHLPFHIFKQATPAPQPVINTQQNTAKTSQTQTTTADPYAGWKTYDDTYATFKYPGTWQVDNSEEKTSKFITLNGPTDNNISLINAGTGKVSPTAKNMRLQAFLYFAPSAQQKDCMGEGSEANTCTVYDSSDITIAQATKTHLVISDFTQSKYPDYITVTDDPAATLNAKTFQNGATINGKYIVMAANIQYQDSSQGSSSDYISSGTLASVSSFKNTQSYKDLVNLFQSVQIK